MNFLIKKLPLYLLSTVYSHYQTITMATFKSDISKVLTKFCNIQKLPYHSRARVEAYQKRKEAILNTIWQHLNKLEKIEDQIKLCQELWDTTENPDVRLFIASIKGSLQILLDNRKYTFD